MTDFTFRWLITWTAPQAIAMEKVSLEKNTKKLGSTLTTSQRFHPPDAKTSDDEMEALALADFWNQLHRAG